MTVTAIQPFDDTRRLLDALAVDEPQAAARARDALERMFGASPSSDYVWIASELTADGYPAEFTFTSYDRLVRYTAAPWPERRPQERLALAERLLGARLPEWLRPLADEHELWVGARHGADSDRYKLCVPTAAPGKAPALARRVVEGRMVSFEPVSGVTERHFRVRRLLEPHLAALLRPAGLEHRAAELAALVREAYGRGLGQGLPGATAGFSLATVDAGPPVFTLYLFARAVWGGDGRIRLRLLELARARGWELGAYEQASAPLAGRDCLATYHSMVGFVVAAGSPFQIAIGLRPPPCV